MQQNGNKKGKGKKDKSDFAKKLGGASPLLTKKHSRKPSSEDVKRSQDLPQGGVSGQDEDSKEINKVSHRFLSFIFLIIFPFKN